MEQIQIFDSINNKNVNVFVAQEIAEKCRLDANFAAELVRQIEEQNVEEGSTIEIETVADIQSSSSDAIGEKELWTRTETLKFLKLYQKYAHKYANNKKALWLIISKGLASRKIVKPPDRCKSKWKNLIRTYKVAKERNNISRFQYYKPVDDILSGKLLVLSDSESEIESCNEDIIVTNLQMEKLKSKEFIEKETWSKYETINFLKLYQKYKHNIENKTCTKEELWKLISNELYKEGIFKTAEKCSIKWKNLFRTYKKILEKDSYISMQRFKYFKEVDDLLSDKEITLPEDLSPDTPADSDFFESGEWRVESFEQYTKNSCIEYEIKEEPVNNKMNMSTWTQEEISKLLWAHNKHKNELQSFENKEKFWELISRELESTGFSRDALECEKEWNNIQSRNSYEKQSTAKNDIIDTSGSNSVEDLQRDESDFSNDQGGDDGCVKIIIETENEGTENPNENHGENSWDDSEIANLIALCAKHIKNNKTKEIPDSEWVNISDNLGCSETQKSADECKQKWEDLLSTYDTCKKLNLECENFLIFENIQEMLNKSDNTNSDNKKKIRTNSCKCNEKRVIEKQRRHTERMQILKRKLDIEERKVKAFEEYVKYIKR